MGVASQWARGWNTYAFTIALLAPPYELLAGEGA